MDLIELGVSAVFGAIGGGALQILTRRLEGRDRARDETIRALDDTEQMLLAAVDQAYWFAVGDTERAASIQARIDGRPWPRAHGDYLGPDVPRYLELFGRIPARNKVGPMELLPAWVAVHELVTTRIASQRRLAEKGRPLERPLVVRPDGPFAQ